MDLKFKRSEYKSTSCKIIYYLKNYIKTQKWIPAINRLKIIVTDYEAIICCRLVEIYYYLGLEDEAKKCQHFRIRILIQMSGLNNHYKVSNKDYKMPKTE